MILDEILAHKHEELRLARERVSAEDLERRARATREPLRGFRRALRETPAPRVVAEIKRRSPSRGEIRPNFDPVGCAKAYAEAGAAAISVLTDERFFGGHLDYLDLVRRAVTLPLLRKDFVVDTYQIDEARVAGADAVLLIAGALSSEALIDLRARALALGMDALVEIHDEEELERALTGGADLIGINNRDLRSFQTDLAVTERLAPQIPQGIVVVSESGIFTPEDVVRLTDAGAHAVLIGESLMREDDAGMALRRVRRVS
jgi:indole-3-glycerol phosphate synthase